MKNLVYSVLEEYILRFRPLGEDITVLKTQIRPEILQNWCFGTILCYLRCIYLFRWHGKCQKLRKIATNVS